MKKILLLTTALLLGMSPSLSSCDKEVGACRLSDLNKTAAIKPHNMEGLIKSKETTAKPVQKVDLKKFIPTFEPKILPFR